MIFDVDTTLLILSGKKTLHVRLVRGEELRPGNLQPGGAVPLERPARDDEMRADLLVAVQAGRARRPTVEVATLLIGEISTKRLGELTPVEARLAGYRTTMDHHDAWVRSRDRRWLATRPRPDDPDLIVARFQRQWADLDVWLIALDVDRDAPTLVAKRSELAYTTQVRQAWRDEPEAVRPEVVDELTARARRDEGQGLTADWLARRGEIDSAIAAMRDGHALSASDAKFLRRLQHMLDLGDRRFAA